MIETLRIENLAVVEEAALEFGSGLNVLTGETGAGKSIVLGALSLLAGARASADAIRDGAAEAAVEAVFRTGRLPELEQELERRGIAPEDGALVVRRTLARNGRSRARIGGELVPVSTLAELFEGRLEISSQHASQRLLRGETQGQLLDATADLLPLRAAVARGSDTLRAVAREITALRDAAEARARSEDFLRFQVQEIDEAKLVAGEREELHRERKRLAHAERLCADADAAARLLAGDPSAELPAALDLIGDALRRVAGLTDLDDSLAALAERLRSAHAELDDAACELARIASGVEADPARLAGIEERLALIERLCKKYGPDETAILAFRERIAGELEGLTGADARLEALEAERSRAGARLRGDAEQLSAGRARAAQTLAREAEGRLRELALPDARFEIALEPLPPPADAPCGPGGFEAAEFRLSANPGEPPRSLRRVASGGELSRVFLALKSALRRADAGMVLVFDEVDAGIGGRVADRVGRVLAELAADHQVLCITHLPQIAARADVHFRVEKRVRQRRSLARVSRLDGDARVEEIARMAAGERVGEATRRHARELLRARRPTP